MAEQGKVSTWTVWRAVVLALSIAAIVGVVVKVIFERASALELGEPVPAGKAPRAKEALSMTSWKPLDTAPVTAAPKRSCIAGAAVISDCNLAAGALDSYKGDSLTLTDVVADRFEWCPRSPVKRLTLERIKATAVVLGSCNTVAELRIVGSDIGRLDVSYSEIARQLEVSRSRIDSASFKRARLGELRLTQNSSIGELDLYHARVNDDVTIEGELPPGLLDTWPTICPRKASPCAITDPPPQAIGLTTIGKVNAAGLEASSFELHGVVVEGELMAKRARLVSSLDTRYSQFRGPVVLSHLHATHIEGALSRFDGGMDMFGVELSGNLDLAFSSVRGSLYALDGTAHIVQLASTTLTDPAPTNPIGDVPWLLSMHAVDYQLTDVRISGDHRLDVRYVKDLAVDLRGTVGPISIHGGSFTALTIDPAQPVHPDSDLGSVTFKELRIGSICADPAATSCKDATTHVIGELREVKRWLQHGPQGVSDILRATGEVAPNLRMARQCYLASMWSSDKVSPLFVLTGDGRRSGFWYAMGLLGLFGLVVATFWARPIHHDDERHPWRYQRWMFAAGVLLPGVIDIGVSLKTDEDEYLWDKAPLLTVAFHLYHALGWFMLTLLAYVVSRSFV